MSTKRCAAGAIRLSSSALLFAALVLPTRATATEAPALGPVRITQDMVTDGTMSPRRLQREGLRIFTTPFNVLDGLGDGPINPSDTTSPGGRPTLQNNGQFLRVNGLDAQTCLECHSIVSAATIPPRLGVGGVGGAVNNAMAMATAIDVADTAGNGFAAFNGRFINPPFLFGAGGVELVAKEMTIDLQALKARAQANPGTAIPLMTKGVSFGSIVFDHGAFDTSGIVGINPDLVVRPFGRKGEFASTRAFDVAAMQFHLGMQPTEVVGADVDADGDGVANEILPGELSALQVFATTLERPRQELVRGPARRGETLFGQIGCSGCHIPELTTRSRLLPLAFPAIETDPTANVYLEVDLTHAPAHFRREPGRGLRVELFADLKRHDLGPALAESTGGALNAQFTTARLWGVADTAPYLHDGRATTLTEAILFHGGEADAARSAFEALTEGDRDALLAFLRTLRTPPHGAEAAARSRS